MKHIIYQITNTTNGKIYIGAHSTDNINDGYMGSGKALKSAIKKYGIDAFNKDVLFVYDNSDDMYEQEKSLVNEEFIRRKDTYNMKTGGRGGGHHRPHSDETKSKLRSVKTGVSNTKLIGRQRSDETKSKISKTLSGRTITDEVRNRMSESAVGKPKPNGFGETLSKQRKGKQLPQGECIHCGKVTSLATIGRFHNDKCKMRVI